MGQKAGFSIPLGTYYIGIRPILHSTSKHAHMEMPEYVSHTNGNLLWDLSKGQALWTVLRTNGKIGSDKRGASWLATVHQRTRSLRPLFGAIGPDLRFRSLAWSRSQKSSYTAPLPSSNTPALPRSPLINPSQSTTGAAPSFSGLPNIAEISLKSSSPEAPPAVAS